MRRPRSYTALLSCIVISALAAGCLLTTDLDGLHNPGASDSGSDGRPPTDSSSPSLTDPDADGSTTNAGDASDAANPNGSNVLFADDFNRPDGPVGNGWLDPTKVYRIKDNAVPVNGSSYCFQCNTLYRPATPDARDINASIEFTPLTIPPSYPQVHIRAQPGDNYRCYAVGIPNTDNTLFFGRCKPGNNFQEIGNQALSENILAKRTYRLSISATGANPVHLVAMLERKTDNGFAVIGKKEMDDTDPDRVTEPGQYGISADTTPNWVYDNFLATKVGN